MPNHMAEHVAFCPRSHSTTILEMDFAGTDILQSTTCQSSPAGFISTWVSKVPIAHEEMQLQPAKQSAKDQQKVRGEVLGDLRASQGHCRLVPPFTFAMRVW